jgi:hypothetical protein
MSLTAEKFSGSAKLSTISFHALKSGTTYIDISDVVVLPDPIILLTEGTTVTILPSYTWASVAGTVSYFETEHAQGWINIFAVVDNWANGQCVFSVPPMGGPMIMIYPPPPFDFTLYLARIVNASLVKLNHNASDFWISGFWGVSNVTDPRSIIDVAKLLKNMVVAPGEFSVKGNWTYYALNIRGFGSIQGNITSYAIARIYDLSGQVPYADINRDRKIDIRDIATVAKGYGSFFGFDRYEPCSDISFDLKIDVKDLAKCAKYFGREY